MSLTIACKGQGNTGREILWLAVLLILTTLSACTGKGVGVIDRDGYPSRPPDVSQVPDAVPKVEPRSRYGNPASYVVFGKRYYVLPNSTGYRERGIASWYGTKFHGRRTSSGEPYDMYQMTAAHKSLPLPTYARVTNLRNGRTVVVRINDRGPFHDNRVIDLSYTAAAKLGILGEGTGLVEVVALDPGRPEPQTPAPQLREARRPPSAPPAAAPAPTLPANPELYLQVGAFVSRSNAEQLSAKLRQVQVPAIHISEGTSNRQPVYRVRIGPLASVAEADRVAAALERYGIDNPHVVID